MLLSTPLHVGVHAGVTAGLLASYGRMEEITHFAGE